MNCISWTQEDGKDSISPTKTTEPKTTEPKTIEPKSTEPKNPDSEEEDCDEYEIEKIIEKRGSGKSLTYLVKWKGYDSDSDLTWEKPRNLAAAKDAVREFEASVKLQTAEKKKKTQLSPSKEKSARVKVTGLYIMQNTIMCVGGMSAGEKFISKGARICFLRWG